MSQNALVTAYVKNVILCVILFSTLGVYLYLFFQVEKNYLPVWSDEFLYYINSRSFFLNSTLKAAITYNGEGARIFGADAHGFAYPLFNGFIAKIGGWHNANFIYTNFSLIFISILLVSTQKFLTISQKILYTILFLLFPYLNLYAMTYMQEVIHVFFAVIASILIYKIYNIENNNKYIGTYIVFLFLAGIFRPFWPFWLIGLLPLAKNKKQFLLYFLLFLVGAIVAFNINSLVNEYVPRYLDTLLPLIKSLQIKAALASFGHHFLANIESYAEFGFSPHAIKQTVTYVSGKYVLIGFLLYYIYKSFTTKNRLFYSITLIALTNFMILLLFYDANQWREIRTMSPLFYFFLLFFVAEPKNTIRLYLLLLILIAPFIFSSLTAKTWVAARNSLYTHQYFEKNVSAFDEISTTLNKKRSALILLDYIPRDNSVDLLSLPLITKDGFSLRYIARYYKVPIENKKIDYILSRSGADQHKNTSVINNDNYSLYINY
ncbi:MAG TPA: hypothetical protein VHE99_07985 [Gammaproteobacteria bacterium]|nr:hypothetical protein [Gammaproteobacteria bacterium]